MSRAIKFRAWDAVTKEMYSHEQLCDPAGDGTSLTFKEFSEFGKNGVAVMQFTGLCDKNGKEIYEGDVVRIDWKDRRYAPVTSQVTWDQDAACFDFGGGIVSEVPWSHEVIGDIYTNPELIAPRNTTGTRKG